MHESIKWRDLLFPAFFAIGVILVMLTVRIIDKNTVMVFCDVGQGDATLIRIQDRIDILIDTGPDSAVLTCLGTYLPFYDKTIEYVIISHADKDHIGGLIPLINHYRVQKLLSSRYVFQSILIRQHMDLFSKKRIKMHALAGNDRILFNHQRLTILWPKKILMKENIGENETNDYSLVALFQENRFSALFTGDATPFSLNNLPEQSITNINILKFPHHGSKQGLDKYFLALAHPGVTVISVGKHNTYGHPSKETMETLKALKTKILRTDEKGNIVFRLP